MRAYADPLAAVRGHEAIDQCVSAAQAQFAGLQFSLGGPIDAHHDQARFQCQGYGFLDKVPSTLAAA